MKPHLTLGLAALALLPLIPPCIQAAQIAPNYEAAQAMPKKDGYLVFAYAQGWDKFSKDLCTKLMNDATIQAAAGESVIIGMPVFQYAKQAQRDFVTEIVGALGIREAESYPAIIFFTPKNRHYATICGPEVMRGNPEELAPLIQKRIAAMHEQEELLDKAEKAEGVEKAKLLGEAARIKGANAPGGIAKQVKQLDPDDSTGYVRSLNLNDFVFTEDFLYETQGIADPNKPKSKREAGTLEDALKKLDELIADPAYTNEQKQTFCANAIGAIHRLGDVTHHDKIKEYAAKMKTLAPETTLGRSADSVVKAWGSGLQYEQGWNTNSLPKDDTPIEVQGDLPINKGGTYKITFKWTGGAESLNIKGVRLFNDRKLIAEDMHDGVAGYSNHARDNTYVLNVRSRVTKPHLYVIFDAAQQRKSNGKIIIERE